MPKAALAVILEKRKPNEDHPGRPGWTFCTVAQGGEANTKLGIFFSGSKSHKLEWGGSEQEKRGELCRRTPKIFLSSIGECKDMCVRVKKSPENNLLAEQFPELYMVSRSSTSE